VVMEPNLEEGFAKLEERFQAQSERARRRLEEIRPNAGQPAAPPIPEEKLPPQVQPPLQSNP
jgi:hypothetical protein